MEGLVGYARRNFLVPVPVVASFAALNAQLERRCPERLDHRVRGHAETIGGRLEHDLAALQPRPPATYDACDRRDRDQEVAPGVADQALDLALVVALARPAEAVEEQ